ncbi:hypothetical protein ACFE04_013255 [Oxalis oulophora]
MLSTPYCKSLYASSALLYISSSPLFPLSFFKISYAGSHGVDILNPACLRADKEKIDLAFQAAARDVLDDIKKVFNSLKEAVQNIKMAKVEDNSYSVNVHFREVDPERGGPRGAWDN